MQTDTFICVGSGPSFTEADAALIARSKLQTIAINNAWERARSAHYIFGGDGEWWDHNIGGIDIPAERWTSSSTASAVYHLNYFRPPGQAWHGGLRAVQLALHLGATRILLVGYDCSVRRGTHYHGDHAHTANPNENVCSGWREQFRVLENPNKIPIINCSRETRLRVFPLAQLEDELCLEPSQDGELRKANTSSAT